MTDNWLNNLEKDLQAKLEDLLKINPLQESLLQNQNQQDVFHSLLIRQKSIAQKANLKRHELLSLAENIKEWKKKEVKAKQYEAIELADQVRQHLTKLMELGRLLWLELDELGIQHKKIQNDLDSFSNKNHASQSNPHAPWEKLEIEKELDLLKKV